MLIMSHGKSDERPLPSGRKAAAWRRARKRRLFRQTSWTHRRIALHDKRRDQTLEPENQSAAARRHPRFKIEVDIGIQSRTCGPLNRGH